MQQEAGRDESGRYTSGNPGRPKGAVNRMSSRVANGILNDFEANHADVLSYLRIHHPTAYATLVGRIIGKSRFIDDEELAPLIADPQAETIAKGARAVKRLPGGKRVVDEMDYEAAWKAAEGGAPSHDEALSFYLRRFWDAEIAERMADDPDETDDLRAGLRGNTADAASAAGGLNEPQWPQRSATSAEPNAALRPFAVDLQDGSAAAQAGFTAKVPDTAQIRSAPPRSDVSQAVLAASLMARQGPPRRERAA